MVSPDGVAPSWMVSVSASVNLPLCHKVQKFSSGTGSPGWSRKKGRKMVVVWWWYTICLRILEGILLIKQKKIIYFSYSTIPQQNLAKEN